MKKLFIYFSLSGNGDLVAEHLKNKGYDIRKVEEKHKPSKIFFLRVLGGGFRAGLGLKGKLINYDNDISNYEEIVLGSPIWNGKFPPAINSVIAQTDFTNKKMTILFYSGSGEMPKAVKKVYKLFPDATIINLKEPKSHEQEFEKIVEL